MGANPNRTKRPGRPALRDRRALLRLAAMGLGGLGLTACSRGGGTNLPSSALTEGVPVSTTATRSPESTAPATRPPAATVETLALDPQCLVTKQRGLPDGYTPSDLMPLPPRLLATDGVRMRRIAGDAVVELIDVAKQEGHDLVIVSGFRSFQEQEAVLRQEIKDFGDKVARQQVAEPGYSEHQLGLAADITPRRNPYQLRPDFGKEPDGRWLAEQAHRFGFVISYPEGKERETGYTYEPWHVRHVGTPMAEKVSASGLTLTEFLPKYNLIGGCP